MPLRGQVNRRARQPSRAGANQSGWERYGYSGCKALSYAGRGFMASLTPEAAPYGSRALQELH